MAAKQKAKEEGKEEVKQEGGKVHADGWREYSNAELANMTMAE